MNNVIFKTALKVLIALVTLVVIAFAVMTFCFPRTMGQISKSFNNYPLSTWYYSLSYTYTGEIEDIATCVENSIILERDSDIVSYGDRLLLLNNFDEYCTAMDEEFSQGEYSEFTTSYKQYIVGNITISKYALGDFDSALDCAKKAIGTDFPRPNAMGLLALEVANKSDKASAATLLTALEAYTPSEGIQTTYYNAMNLLLRTI